MHIKEELMCNDNTGNTIRVNDEVLTIVDLSLNDNCTIRRSFAWWDEWNNGKSIEPIIHITICILRSEPESIFKEKVFCINYVLTETRQDEELQVERYVRW